MILNLLDSAPVSLGTLNELANAVADDSNCAAWVKSSVGLKIILSKCTLSVISSYRKAQNENMGSTSRHNWY